MKNFIIITACLIIGIIGCWAGYNLGSHIGYEKILIEKEIAVKLAYEEGLQKGMAGVKVEYGSPWHGIWSKALSLGYPSVHDTPWNEFTIQEKMFLCAYGSPGNSLSDEEIGEIKEVYGQ